MIGTLKRIVAYDKQRKPSFLSQVLLSAGKGIPGDRHWDDDRDPISVWFYPPDIEDLGSWPPPEQRKGLCTVKFRANLMVEPVPGRQNTANLAVGDLLRVGDAVLAIHNKKPCYDQCPLVASGKACGLKDNVYFTSVTRSGTISVGGRVEK
ncbi:MAG: hypothetical protein ACOYJU_07735 [Anaerovoracaceae bacterium]|jgi:hypothetical protein